ncbi:isocitrate/isopropylmalate family dehydrogenase [Compostimonas suwonensis]|uniref:3-isopropylmalate dehydrogenase n=1 Tax=Compostimonas suwonensis TaxID=1048394 RepID=A0A2M9BBS4_9MICO|nr:isocitrate/isopropylmalate family dehydrogenase [Compostimonas suwonensis]PJJ55364.1 3-isopropylmalate dehydrogenase [Compostimonas suwonensis]
MTPVIAVVPGSHEGRAALDEIGGLLASLADVVELRTVELGVETYRRTGQALPAEALEALRSSDAIVIAAPPGPGPADGDIAPGVLEHGIVFALRRALGLSVNLRTFTGVGEEAGIDIAVVRENSEGAYFSPGDLVHDGTADEIAVQAVVTSASAVERCLRYGFEQARLRGQSLVVAHKVRVLTVSGGIWIRTAERVARDFPDVAWRVESIDTCCGRIVSDPRSYGVIATDNVFGDILADVVSARARAGDYAVSVERPLGRSGPSLFEPMHDTHSSAAEHLARRHLGLIGAFGAALVDLGLVERGTELHTASIPSTAGSGAGA